jgi:hypothetical protein
MHLTDILVGSTGVRLWGARAVVEISSPLPGGA